MNLQRSINDRIPGGSEATENSAIGASVEQALRTTGYLALRRVQVSAIPFGVELQGTVSTYHLKQLAQALFTQQPAGFGLLCGAGRQF